MTTLHHVHVVVTCSHRKTRAVPRHLELRRVTAVRTETRRRAWTTQLADHPTPTLPATDLYAGEHWRLARQLSDTTASGVVVTLWVCSAGYGLIRAETAIKPYSATFTRGYADSIPGGREEAAEWWAALGEWTPPGNAAPRTIQDLASAHCDAALLLVLSSAYFRACRDDILATTEQLDDPTRLSIISAGTHRDPDLAEWLLPVDARLQHALGGARQSLNIRVAATLIAGGIVARDAARESLTRLLVDQPPLPQYARMSVTDAAVRAYIEQRLRRDPYATHTRLLREFRDSGHACEQRRFAALFRTERRLTA